MYNILDFSLLELKQWMKDNGEKEFRAKQIMDAIYKGEFDFYGINNIPNSLKDKLSINFKINIPKIADIYKSKEDGTSKLLLKYIDGNIIEIVIMKYKHGYSVCLSTQVGCRMGCQFCASTINGMVRNLTCGEILGQIMVAESYIGERISNIVLMGSGEPLDNYDEVIKFLEIVNSDYSFNIGQRHITLSTCGIVPKIYELAELNLQITLAISLHSPDNDLRKTIMPITNKYEINDIIKACRYYINKTGRRITFEYALISGVNDSDFYANMLSQLLKGLICHVNLIPINQIKEKEYKGSNNHDAKAFSKLLISKGIETTIRREMGGDINAACGQLRRNYLETNLE